MPSAAGLALLGLSTIGAIYQGGRFQAYDIQQTAPALACYAIGRAGYAAIKAPAPAFYALGETPHADVRQPGLDGDQLRRRLADDPHRRQGPRRALPDPAPPHRRHPPPQAGPRHGPDPGAMQPPGALVFFLAGRWCECGGGRLF